VRLDQLKTGDNAVVQGVAASHDNDLIARRLRDLGFVAGEPVRIVARAPLGGDPLLVTVGFTRFALRRSEAARIDVAPVNAASAGAAA